MAAAGHQDRLALIELLDRDGHARVTVPVTQWPVSIGRAIDCDVVLDDPHVAARHALLTEANGTVRLEVGSSVNGVRLGKQLVSAGHSVPVDGRTPPLQLGTTRLRVRLAGDALEPEKVLVAERVLPWWGLTLLLAGVLLWLLARQWLETDPGEPAVSFISKFSYVPLALAAWCAVCALGSMVFRHHFAFLPHLGLALGWMMAMLVTELALHMLAYMFGWSWASRISVLVQGALGAAWLYSHLALIVPRRRGTMAAVVGTLFVASSITSAALNYQRYDRFFDELYMAALGPPALRLAPAQPVARFFQDAESLRDELDARARVDDEDPAAAEAAEAAAQEGEDR